MRSRWGAVVFVVALFVGFVGPQPPAVAGTQSLVSAVHLHYSFDQYYFIYQWDGPSLGPSLANWHFHLQSSAHGTAWPPRATWSMTGPGTSGSLSGYMDLLLFYEDDPLIQTRFVPVVITGGSGSYAGASGQGQFHCIPLIWPYYDDYPVPLPSDCILQLDVATP